MIAAIVFIGIGFALMLAGVAVLNRATMPARAFQGASLFAIGCAMALVGGIVALVKILQAGGF